MTPPRPMLQLPAYLRRYVVGLLLVALPLYGLGGALLRMLGPDHRHEAVAEAPTWSDLVGGPLQSLTLALVGPETARLIDHLRLQARLRPPASGHAHGGGAHHHHHGEFARHHHAPHDATVVATDGHGGADAATAGSTLLPLALPAALAIPRAPASPLRWPDHGASPWHSHVPALPERPPRA
ncbi:MAG: hypothetical protein QM777_24790 [Pseudorhodoferax sp.]